MAGDQEANREVGVEEQEEEEKGVKHYSSNHQILLVGEGDFSFSFSLARSFGSASNILASSLDSYDVVIKKYKEAKSNLENLEKLGASLLHGVDATRMKFHTHLKIREFDRIVFNFPHVGFYGKENNAALIKMHRDLVNGFFRNSSGMLRANGEIHVNHKTTVPFCYWNIPELASQNSLELVERVDFKKEDFPGYNNKRGDGLRCDEAFPLGECSTFKFRFFRTTKKMHRQITHWASSVHGRSQQFQGIPIEMQQCSTSINFSYPLAACHLTNMEQTSEHMRLPLTSRPRNQRSKIFYGHSNNHIEIFGRTDYDFSHSFHAPRLHVVRDFPEIPRRNLSGDINILDEIYPLSTSSVHERFQQFQGIPIEMQQCSTSLNSSYPLAACCLTNMEQTSEHMRLPLTSRPRNQRARMFDGPLNNPTEIFGRTDYDFSHSFHAPTLHVGRDFPEIPRRNLSGDINILSEICPMSTSSVHGRSKQFQGIPIEMQQCSTSTSRPGNQRSRMFDRHLNDPTEIFGRTDNDLSHSFHAPRLHVARDFFEVPRRNLSGDKHFG